MIERRGAAWRIEGKIADVMRSDARQGIAFVLVFGVFFALATHFFERYARLKRHEYAQEILFDDLVTQLPVVVVLFGIAGLGAWKRKSLSWGVIGEFGRMRFFVLAVSAPIMWYAATLDFDHLAGFAHRLDRLLILASWLAIWIHPLFVPVFFLFAASFLFQLQVPFPVSTTDKRLVLNLMVAFSAYLPASLALVRRKSHALVFVSLVVVGCHYAYPALHKAIAGWIFYERLEELFLSAVAQGFAPLLAWPDAREIAGFIEATGPVLLVGTQLLEALGWALLFHPRLAQLALVGLIGMHLGIAATSGIFFWKWIVADTAAVILVQSVPAEERRRIFGLWPGLVAIAMIALAPIAMNTLRLTWFDTPVSYVYSIEAETADGERYRVPPHSFAPFDLPLSQGALWYLEDELVITTHFGKVKSAAALRRIDEVLTSGDPEELRARLPELRREIGEDRRKPGRRDGFVAFLETFFASVNERGFIEVVPPRLRAPYHIQVGTRSERVWTGERPVTKVRVWRDIVWVLEGPHSVERVLLVEAPISAVR